MVTDFITCVAVVVGGIIALKVFFSLWGRVDRRWNPGKIGATPETAFKDIKNKVVRIVMKSGETVDGCTYEKTLWFNDGEMAMNTVVYFKLRTIDKRSIYISGSDILRIEEKSAQFES